MASAARQMSVYPSELLALCPAQMGGKPVVVMTVRANLPEFTSMNFAFTPDQFRRLVKDATRIERDFPPIASANPPIEPVDLDTPVLKKKRRKKS